MGEDCDDVARLMNCPESQQPTGYPTELERQVTLVDGRVVFVRPIVPGDIDGLRAAIAAADEETLQDRFLGWHPHLGERDLHRLTEVDYQWRMALVALDEAGTGVAIARYEGQPGSDSAELAIAVDRRWRRVGLGSRLLTMLALAAVGRELRRFRAIYLAENHEVDGLVRASGLPRTQNVSQGVAEVEIDLTPLLCHLAP